MNVVYLKGPSPDEVTLCDAAKNYGYAFEGNFHNKITLDVLKKKREIEVLKQFDFNSDRKRMSVIVRYNNTIYLYLKGADNIVIKRLKS